MSILLYMCLHVYLPTGLSSLLLWRDCIFTYNINQIEVFHLLLKFLLLFSVQWDPSYNIEAMGTLFIIESCTCHSVCHTETAKYTFWNE
jgi:hypothetical protein